MQRLAEFGSPPDCRASVIARGDCCLANILGRVDVDGIDLIGDRRVEIFSNRCFMRKRVGRSEDASCPSHSEIEARHAVLKAITVSNALSLDRWGFGSYDRFREMQWEDDGGRVLDSVVVTTRCAVQLVLFEFIWEGDAFETRTHPTVITLGKEKAS